MNWRAMQPIRLLNPIASQMGVMRSSLLGSLLQVLKFNTDRRAERVRVFELGRAFLRDASEKTPTPPPSRAITSPCAWPAWPMVAWI